MTWVKICGMTNLEDALVAAEAGADAVGFVFYEKSPRYVTIETAREICEKLPESVEKIGVFVSPDSDPIRTMLEVGLTGTQCYVSKSGIAGSESKHKAIDIDLLPVNHRSMIATAFNDLDVESVRTLGRRTVQVGSAADGSLQEIPLPANFPVATFVLDSGNKRSPGGTGIPFDWKEAAPIANEMRENGVRLVVAGGLTVDNVAGAIEMLRPFGVDVVSGVETSPGKKDPEKVRAFVTAVREYDRRVG